MPIEFLPVIFIFVFYTALSIAVFILLFKRERKEKENRFLTLEKQNKALAAVWDIEQIIVNNLEFTTVGQQIVQAILIQLEQYGYVFVFLFMIDEQKKVLTKFSGARKKDLKATASTNSFFSKNFTILLEKEENLIVQAIQTGQMMMGENFTDVFGSVMDAQSLLYIQSELGVRTSIAFPVAGKEKKFGGLLFGATKQPQDISVYEIKLMQGFVNAVNIAMENSALFETVNKTREKLQHANEQLQELDKLKDEFVSLASHELRTPMTAIRGSLSTILDGYVGEVNEKTREFLTAAYNENDRLIRLVNNLLNISRIEAGRMIFTITKINLNKVIAEVVENFRMAGQEKEIAISYTENTLPLVSGDEDKIREVLINLVGNAIKFTQKGGITITAHSESDMIITSVADTGHGIAKKDQDLLFKKFSQVKGYSKQSGGTGLGLYISKKIIEGLQGKMWVESEVGKGSVFHFSLPVLTTPLPKNLPLNSGGKVSGDVKNPTVAQIKQ